MIHGILVDRIFSVILTALWISATSIGLVNATDHEDNPCAVPPSSLTPSDIESAIGVPVSHNDIGDQSNLTPICHEQFCSSYNSNTKLPDWVVERLSPAITDGKNTRPSTKFKPDKNLPNDKASAKDKDYTKSGLARGHQAASADFKCNAEWMKQTFTFANAVPQIQNGFNGGIWRSLEDRVQNLAKERDEIFVITGPVAMDVFGRETIIEKRNNACGRRIVLAGLSKLKKASICDANDKDSSKVCENGVNVPAGLFKIIYVPKTNRAFGFVLSNEDHRKLKRSGVNNTAYLEKWRVSIEAIEFATNLKFFTNLNIRSSRVHKEHCTETRWR